MAEAKMVCGGPFNKEPEEGEHYGPIWKEVAGNGQRSDAEDEGREAEERPERENRSESKTGHRHRTIGSPQERG